MKKTTLLLATVALVLGGSFANAQHTVKDLNATFKVGSDLMTPEALWAMGRIGGATTSPDGKQVVYQVGYYSVKKKQKSADVVRHGRRRKKQTSAHNRTAKRDRWRMD